MPTSTEPKRPAAAVLCWRADSGDLPVEFPDPWLLDTTTDGATVRALNAVTGQPAGGTVRRPA
jgi:hypothetical protein